MFENQCNGPSKNALDRSKKANQKEVLKNICKQARFRVATHGSSKFLWY
jgi:hypothetical protein